MTRLPGSGKTSRKDSLRSRRYIAGMIGFLVLALVATQIFLHQTSVGSPRFVRATFLLLGATVVVVLAILILATVLGRNLIKLYFEKKSGQVGSRFKAKMVRIFVALSLLPALLLFFLAYGLINVSVQQWFSAPAGQLLENSRAIALQYYEETQNRAQHFARVIASAVSSEGALDPERHPALREKLAELTLTYGIDDVRIFDRRGRVAGETGRRISTDYHAAWVKELVGNALAGSDEFKVERVSPRDALQEVVWAAAAVRDAEGRVIGAVLTESLIPKSVYFKAHSVLEAYNVYEELRKREAALRYNFLLILALATLLITFAFLWFAMYLAKRITVPIQALAEGAAEVAAGNLDYRVDCDAFDELESLVDSFNRMTAELQEHKANIEQAQGRLQQSNIELDHRRRYIETILQNIATGVISLDANYRVRTMNQAAIQMLGCTAGTGEPTLEEVVQGEACDALRMLLHKSAVLGRVVRNIELILPDRTLHVAATVTPLVDNAGARTGWVMVLDDLTELIRMEKMAAWQEVARRLAHEIKNPLTPIQLSAERILHRYRQLRQLPAAPVVPAGGGGDPDTFDGLLRECVQTIIQEAGSLKKLVDEFSRFARLPQLRPEDADLHSLLDSILSLYNGRVQGIEIRRHYDHSIPLLRLDPQQMKRVFINIFDNALEAMAGPEGKKELDIRTTRGGAGEFVRIEICDTGRGFPRESQDSLFLPYFSTRKGGTGLGLAIVRQIVTDHHGQVRAEPNFPRGARLVVELPAAAT